MVNYNNNYWLSTLNDVYLMSVIQYQFHFLSPSGWTAPTTRDFAPLSQIPRSPVSLKMFLILPLVMTTKGKHIKGKQTTRDISGFRRPPEKLHEDVETRRRLLIQYHQRTSRG